MGNCLSALRSSKSVPIHVPPYSTSTTPPTSISSPFSTLPVSTPPGKTTVAIDTVPPTTSLATSVITALSPTLPDTFPSQTPSTQPNDLINTTRFTTTPQACLTTTTPNDPQYTVFISHAGEDKATIAIPLRDKLRARGISAFVDEADMRPGTDAKRAMIAVMETADVGVMILSPEFVAREWPMRELMCFLRRREECGVREGGAPIVIPCFYRLRVDELYMEPQFDRKDKNGKLLYEESRFVERAKSGEAGARISGIKAALETVHGLMGVRNDVEATNESSFLMSKRRELLLKELSSSVEQAVLGGSVNQQCAFQRINDEISQASVDRFQRFFPPLSSGVQAILDFGSKDEDGNPMTPEGWVKHYMLGRRSDCANVVSIHGIGGVGKSTIMRALSVDGEIRRCFVDGVHIITLGKDASRATVFRQICQVLKDSGAEKTSESIRTENDIDEALHSLEKWFDGKRCAIFIDDLWVHRVGLDVMSRLCKLGSGVSRNCVMLTTREYDVAALAPREKTVRVEPRVTRGQDARRILFFHADLPGVDPAAVGVDVNESITDVLDICGGLPVSLAAAGKNVKMLSMDMPNEEGAWKHYLSEVVSCRERLLRENVEGYGNLFATFATSISILDQQPQQEVLGFASKLSFAKMYRRLCVLRKQAAAPGGMLKHLWEVESEIRASRIARKFVEAGLASRKFVRIEEDYLSYLSLHDSLHEFAVAEAKRHDDVREAHDSLLRGYSSCDAEICCEVKGTLKWWSPRLEGDRYIHGNVCRHLLGAGRDREVVALVLSPLWAKRQLEVNDFLCLEGDFTIGITAVQEGMRNASDVERGDVEKALRLIPDAVTLSSIYISSNIAELWFQLSGRLIRYAEGCKALREYLRRIETDGERPILVCKNSFLTEAGGPTTKVISIAVEVHCMALLKDGENVACGVDDGRILVVNVRRGVVAKEWVAHDVTVKAISVGSDRKWLVSGSLDGTAKVWNFESCCCVAVFNRHTAAVTCIAMMKNETRVISGSFDGTVQVWDMETGQSLSTLFTRYEGSVKSVAVLQDGERVLTGGNEDKLRLWNVTTGELIDDTLDGYCCWSSCIAVLPDQRRIVSGSYENEQSVMSVRAVEGQERIGSSFKGHTDSVSCVAVSADGRRALSASFDNTIRGWDLEKETEVCDPLTGHTDWVTGVAFLSGNDRIVSSSLDGTVRVWDMRRTPMERVRPTQRHSSAVNSVSFSPDGKFVFSANCREVRIWNTKSVQEVANLLPHDPKGISDGTSTASGQTIVSVYEKKSIRVWDSKSNKLLRTFTGHTDSIECVAITPQGNRVVTGSRDKTVRVWDIATIDGRPIVLEGHAGVIVHVFVTDDGLRVVSTDWNYNIFVWDLESKKVVNRCRNTLQWLESRRSVLSLVNEADDHDDMKLWIKLFGREIVYIEGVEAIELATMESCVRDWAVSPDKKTICLGLQDGHVGLINFEDYLPKQEGQSRRAWW